jgi:glycine cleavage system H lipoate-binding protein
MKQFVEGGKIWVERGGDGVSNIGFTKQFIDEKFGECFHILPADSKNIRERGALLVIETNDGLESLKSPVAGRVMFFNQKARDFPDKITEEDVIFRIETPPKVVAKKREIKPMPLRWDVDDQF